MSVIIELSVTDPRMAMSVTDIDGISELEFSFPNVPALITHVGFIVKNSTVANRTFKLVGVESRRAEHEEFAQLYDCEIQGHDYSLEFTYQGSAVLVPALGLSYATKLTFECEQDPDDFDQEVAAISNRVHWAANLFQETYASVSLIGFPLNSNPTASHVVTLLNAASYLRNCREGIDADYLAGLALMNARRFVQASEFIRRAQARLVGSLDMPLNFPRSAVAARPPSATTNKKLLRAAKLELLVAEGFNQHGQIFDKLLAYERATELFLGGTVLEAVSLDSDVYSSLLTMQPHLGRLLLRNLQDKLEPLRIACVRGLEFVLENLGCSLGTQFTLLLKTVIKSYPSNGSPVGHDSFSNSLLSSISVSDIMKEEASPILIDSYNRLLETCLNTLSSCAPQLLHSIFYEVLGHNLQLLDLPSDLKNYIVKFTEKITMICEGDLQFSNSLLSGIIAARVTDETAECANHLWELVKSKVLIHYTGNRLAKLIQWMKELLMSENEQDNVGLVLELIYNLSLNEQSSNSLLGPRHKPELVMVVPILAELLDYATSSHDRIDMFCQVWACLVNVSQQLPDLDLLALVIDLLEKTKAYCAEYSPSVNMLKFLEQVLSSLKPTQRLCEFLLEFLSVFCRVIPSNVNDEIFRVLDLILRFIGKYLSREHIVDLIEALLDQYTVKSQSQRQSKAFVTQLVLSNPSYFEVVIDFCLIENRKSELDPYKHDRQTIVTDHDRYLEKVSFAIEVISLMEEPTASLLTAKLEPISHCCARLLQSRDSHLRIRGLEILRLVAEAYLVARSQDPGRVSKYILDVIAPVLESAQDPKMTFFCLQLVDMVFKHLLPGKLRDRAYQEARCVEALNVWTHVHRQIDSAWSNIRAIAFSILCSCVQMDLSVIRPPIQHKIKSAVLPLVLSLLASKDSESRAGGLNLLGSFCALSLADEQSSMEEFRKYSEQVPLAIWEQVFHLQDDWDPMIRDAATVLIQLSAPRDAVRHFHQRQLEEYSLKYATGLRNSEGVPEPTNEESLFWIDMHSMHEILELVSMFRNDSKNPSQLWNEYKEPREEDDREDIASSAAKGEEEPETLEDLGIIDVDDEMVGEEDYPIIKNSYPKKRHKKRSSPPTEDHTWTRALRPHNASLRPCTPPAKPQIELPRQIRPPSKHSSREELPVSITPPRQMPQPPPKVPKFDIEEPVTKPDFVPELDAILAEEETKEGARRSPRTPRRRVDDLPSKLRGMAAVPHSSALNRIYMHKPEPVVKKKSKSLNSSLIRQRRQSAKMTKTPVRKD